MAAVLARRRMLLTGGGVLFTDQITLNSPNSDYPGRISLISHEHESVKLARRVIF